MKKYLDLYQASFDADQASLTSLQLYPLPDEVLKFKSLSNVTVGVLLFRGHIGAGLQCQQVYFNPQPTEVKVKWLNRPLVNHLATDILFLICFEVFNFITYYPFILASFNNWKFCVS